MARVIIDTCITSEDWFKNEVVKELVAADKVEFVYSNHKKFLGEMSRNSKLLTLIKLMRDKGRCKLVSAEDCGALVDNLEQTQCWANEAACDDPHIFAVVALLPTRYVFTADTRMAQCRAAMRNKLKAKYLNFIVVGTPKVYKRHREKILS